MGGGSGRQSQDPALMLDSDSASRAETSGLWLLLAAQTHLQRWHKSK